MPHKQAEQADAGLEEGDLPREAVLPQGAAPDEPEVEEGEVAGLDEAALVVGGDLEQAQLAEEVEGLGDEGVRLALGAPGGDAGFEEAGAGVELGEAVAGAGDEAEDLRGGVEEVEELGDEEEAESL